MLGADLLLGPSISAAPPSSSPPLDSLTVAPLWAHSSRKLRTGATKTMNVTAYSSGNSADIGFVGGDMDEASVSTLLAGYTTSGIVQTLYNQAASGPASATTGGPNAVVCRDSSPRRVNGHLALHFEDNTETLTTPSFSSGSPATWQFVSVVQTDTGNARDIVRLIGAAVTTVPLRQQSGALLAAHNGTYSSAISYTDGSPAVLALAFDGTTYSVRLNGTQVATIAASGAMDSSVAYNFTAAYVFLPEHIFQPGYNLKDLQALEASAKAYWGIS